MNAHERQRGKSRLGRRADCSYLALKGTTSELFTIALLLWALITSFYRSWKTAGISINLARIIQEVEELES